MPYLTHMPSDLCHTYRAFQKKRQNVCLLNISKTNKQISKPFFFFWKLRSICKFQIQNQFCAIVGGWDIYKTKRGSGIDKYIFILTWGGPHSTRVALRWPDWLLTAPVIPWEALRAPSCPNWYLRGSPGHSGASRGISKPLWCCEDHLRPVWICTCIFRNPV